MSDKDVSIRCPQCHCRHFLVVWVRHHVNKIVRRRECRHCGKQITTSETIIQTHAKK